MSRSEERSARAGYTLVEALVVVAIIACALGLMLPAVRGARESAARAHCQNNLRHLGSGVHHFRAVLGPLPSNGGWDGRQTITSVNGDELTVSTTTNVGGLTTYWGVGDPRLAPWEQTGSWLYSTLPYVGQSLVWRKRAWELPVKGYVCPSRGPARSAVPVDDAEGHYEGGGWAWAKTDYAANVRLIPNRTADSPAPVLGLHSIADGISQTILAGEKAMEPCRYRQPGWYADEPFFLGGSESTAHEATEVRPDAGGGEGRPRWGSAHVSAAHLLFADGSVRRMNYDTPASLMDELLEPKSRAD